MKLKVLGPFIIMVIAGLNACEDANPKFHESDSPLRLSDWNLLRIENASLRPNQASLKFQPANALFSDYAHKFRTLWVPEDSKIGFVDGSLDYPVGTILTKTFYYPKASNGNFLQANDDGQLYSLPLNDFRLLETRLLVRRESEWVAFPYVWNEDQTEAFLRIAGASISATIQVQSQGMDFTYFVPNENQCAGCHTRDYPDGGLEPLGAIAKQLNHSMIDRDGETKNLLAAIRDKGWLDLVPALPAIPSWQNMALPIDQRARAYLDINCGHCHNPDGPADTSALLLDGIVHTEQAMGLCKPPVAAGGGAGDRNYGIVPGEPDKSILLYRMQSVQPDEMMPELGRSLVHNEGVDLISTWISQLNGTCQ